MTSEDLEVLRQHARRLKNDPIAFAEELLIIQDKSMQFTPLKFNRAQRHYLANRTKRDLILKSRQLGFSTLIQSLHYWYAVTTPSSIMTMADKHKNTQKLRRMQSLFYDRMRLRIRPERSENNASITVYPKIGSQVEIDTAGSHTAGRGSTYRFLHGSEVAFWKKADTAIAGALQAIPEHLPNTWVVFESTPNGASGWFYDECMRALRNESEWELHFYAWWWDDEYRLPLASGERLEYTPEEIKLVERHGLSQEQIKWRRSKQNTLKDMFLQEYPEDPVSCFINTMGDVFTISQMNLYEPVEDRAIEGRVYVAGVDWADYPDATAVSIFDATEGREVAIHRFVKMNYSEQIDNIVKLCQRWKIEKIVVEDNGVGRPNAQRLAEALENVVYDNGYDATLRPFTMTQHRKHSLIQQFKIGLQEDLLLVDNDIATAELNAMEKTKSINGLYSYSHPSVGHDDTVIARLLAYDAIFNFVGT